MLSKESKIAYKDVLELKLLKKDLALDDKFSFCVIDSTNELINEVYPLDGLIDI